MVTVIFEAPDGSRREIEGQVGESIMEIALAADVRQIVADCGGSMSCATCHIHIAPEWLPITGEAQGDEIEMLEMAIDPDETSRLSCQVKLSEALNGLIVHLPERQF